MSKYRRGNPAILLLGIIVICLALCGAVAIAGKILEHVPTPEFQREYMVDENTGTAVVCPPGTGVRIEVRLLPSGRVMVQMVEQGVQPHEDIRRTLLSEDKREGPESDPGA